MRIKLDTGTTYDTSIPEDVKKLKDNLRKMPGLGNWERIKSVRDQVEQYKKYRGESNSRINARKIYEYSSELLKSADVLLAEQTKRLSISESRKQTRKSRTVPLSLVSNPQTDSSVFSLPPSFSSISFQQFPRVSALQVKETPKQNLNWKDVACVGPEFNWLTQPSAQIVSVTIDGKISRFCSGFNIGNNYFLTAGHCLGNVCYELGKYSGNYAVSFNYQYPVCDARGVGVGVGVGAGEVREQLYTIEEIVEHGNCNQIDYAIFRLHPNAQKTFGSVSLRSDKLAQGAEVAVVHHAAGGLKKVSPGEVLSSCSMNQRYYDASGQELQGDISHTAHTLGGSSGSAIGLVSKKAVVGLHVAGDNNQTSHIGLSIFALSSKSKVIERMSSSDFRTNSSSYLSSSSKPRQSIVSTAAAAAAAKPLVPPIPYRSQASSTNHYTMFTNAKYVQQDSKQEEKEFGQRYE